MFAVDVDLTEENITWFRNLKQQLAKTFNQLEIYLAGMEIFWVQIKFANKPKSV